MAGTYDDEGKDPMLDAFTALAVRVALHTDDPGGADSALNEVSGGGYARQVVTFAAASAGSVTMTDTPAFSVPAVTVAWISFWSADGTHRYAKVQLDTPAIFGTPGTFTLTAGTIDLSLS